MLENSKSIFVAPMVRVSTLPFRLLCLDYGADIVYTEETIDFKMLRSIKKSNDLLGTTDFVDKSDGTIFFRTCPREKENLVFQIGTSDPQRALKVAKSIEDYVARIDINMGCPKEFSLKGGMGAALLTQPEKVRSVLSLLVQNLKVPVTCKIRLLPSVEETLSLCRIIQECGVHAIAVHGRTKEERSRHPNHDDVIKKIVEALDIPVIANGGSKEIAEYADIESFKLSTNASSVMIARAVMWNCSILRKEGKLPIHNVIKAYLSYCIKYDNPFTFTKYTIQNMLRDQQSTELGKAFLETQTLQEICSLWGLNEEFESFKIAQMEKVSNSMNTFTSFPLTIDDIKAIEMEECGRKLITMPLQFIRGNFASAKLPKMLVNNYVYQKSLDKAKYTCMTEDRFFYAYLDIEGIRYQSSLKEKSRRYAEQAAAMVFLHAKKLVEKTYGFRAQEGTRKYQNFSVRNGQLELNKKRSPNGEDAESIKYHKNLSDEQNGR